MTFKLFHQAALAQDLAAKHLRKRDVVTIVDVHPADGRNISKE